MMDIMDIMDITDIMDIMNIMKIMNNMNITVWMAMAGGVSALVSISWTKFIFQPLYTIVGAETS